jgi:hypothetical protein
MQPYKKSLSKHLALIDSLILNVRTCVVDGLEIFPSEKPGTLDKSGYVHPRRNVTTEIAMRITKIQTRLNAIRSAPSNFLLRHIYIAAP